MLKLVLLETPCIYVSFVVCHVLCVMRWVSYGLCQVSCIVFHMSSVMSCHVPPVTCHWPCLLSNDMLVKTVFMLKPPDRLSRCHKDHKQRLWKFGSFLVNLSIFKFFKVFEKVFFWKIRATWEKGLSELEWQWCSRV